MGNPISSRMSYEWTPDQGIHIPTTASTSRAIYPSYASSTQHLVTLEPFSFSISTPSLASGATSTVSRTQTFANIQGLKLASFDTGNIVFTNISVSPPANTAAFHPGLQLVSSQGNPVNGILTPAITYKGLGIKAVVQIMATASATAGTLTISGVAMLIGSATT